MVLTRLVVTIGTTGIVKKEIKNHPLNLSEESPERPESWD